MKDALGHGSNIMNGGLPPQYAKGFSDGATPFHYHGAMTPHPVDSSNSAAATSLASGPKSTPVPVHAGASGPGPRNKFMGSDAPSDATDPKLG